MIQLFDEATGRALGAISEEDLAFLQANLEEESLADDDYWINAATVELLAGRGASAELVAVLAAAVGDGEQGVDIAFQRAGGERERLRR
jgi:hypothetical protein